MRTGEEIKAARNFLRESQSVFAERFGVDQATISRWETEGLPDRTLRSAAAANAIELFLASLKPSTSKSDANLQSTQVD